MQSPKTEVSCACCKRGNTSIPIKNSSSKCTSFKILPEKNIHHRLRESSGSCHNLHRGLAQALFSTLPSVGMLVEGCEVEGWEAEGWEVEGWEVEGVSLPAVVPLLLDVVAAMAVVVG